MISCSPLPDAPRLLARLEERVLLVQALFGGAQALDEPRVGDGERRVVREHGAHVEVRAREDAGALAVVHLKTPRISSPFHSGTPMTLRICAPMSDSGCPTSCGASAAITAARSITTLRKTLRVTGMGAVGGPLLAAHARHDRHVARRSAGGLRRRRLRAGRP